MQPQPHDAAAAAGAGRFGLGRPGAAWPVASGWNTWTTAEVAEIEAASRALVESGADLAQLQPAGFPLPTLAPRLARLLHELLEGRGLRAAARPAGATLAAHAERSRLPGTGLPPRPHAPAKRRRPSARPCARCRPERERPQRAHLPDARAPDLPHRFLRHRRPAVPADGALGRAVGAGLVDHAVQRDAPTPAGSGGAAVRAAGHRPPRRGAARRPALVRNPGLQLV